MNMKIKNNVELKIYTVEDILVFLFGKFFWKYSRSNLANAFYAEVLLDGSLIAAEHASPVNGSTNHHAPETVPDSWAGIHVEELHSSWLLVDLPHQGGPSFPRKAVPDNQKEGAKEHRCLERICHYDSLHSTLN